MAGTLERQRDVYKEVVDMDWKEVVVAAPRNIVKNAVLFCENHECGECPIYINDIEHRTQEDKMDFIPCVDNLIYEMATRRIHTIE